MFTILGPNNGVQYFKMEHAPRISATDTKKWDLEQVVMQTENNFTYDFHFLMTETTNYPNLLIILMCLRVNIIIGYLRSNACIKKRPSTKKLMTTVNTRLNKLLFTVNKMPIVLLSLVLQPLNQPPETVRKGCSSRR